MARSVPIAMPATLNPASPPRSVEPGSATVSDSTPVPDTASPSKRRSLVTPGVKYTAAGTLTKAGAVATVEAEPKASTRASARAVLTAGSAPRATATWIEEPLAPRKFSASSLPKNWLSRLAVPVKLTLV